MLNRGAAVLFMASVIPATALAQQAVTPPSSASASANGGALGDIVVTASRRAVNLQKAPLPVSVISNDAIIRSALTQPQQLETLIPALQITQNGPTSVIYLRGVGAFETQAYADPAVAFNYDGVYLGRPTSTTGMFYDLSRVEVVKGPQGTLYGRNATGGAINIIPQPPILGDSTGFISASYGNYDAVLMQGAVNIPLTKDSALRISGTYDRHNGYLSDGTSDANNYGARIQYLAEPNSQLSVRLGADFYHAGGAGQGQAVLAYVPTTGPQAGQILKPPFGLSTGLFDPRVNTLLQSIYSGQVGRTLEQNSAYPYQNSNFWGVNAEIKWRTPVGDLTVIPAYRQSDLLFDSAYSGAGAYEDETDRQESLETRFSGNNGRVRWVVGGYFYHEDITAGYAFVEPTYGGYENAHLQTTSAAGFGQVTFSATDTLRLSAGVRYTADFKSLTASGPTVFDICLAASCPGSPLLAYGKTFGQVVNEMGLSGPFPSPIPGFSSAYYSSNPAAANNVYAVSQTNINDSHNNSAAPTVHFGLEWDARPATLIYANFDTGYRSGGFSFANEVNLQKFAPEYITAYTIGAKNRFFDNKLQINVEGFIWDYKDEQVSHLGIGSFGEEVYFTQNIGKSTNEGVEADAKLKVGEHTILSADVQYLSAIYNSFTYYEPSPSLTACATGAPPTTGPNAGQYPVNCSGKTAQHSPAWTANFGIEHTIPVGTHRLVFEADTHYQSGSSVGFELLPIEQESAYWLTNASVTFESQSGAWGVTLFVNNLENVQVSTNILDAPTSIFVSTLLPPRTFGVRLSAKY